MSSPTAPPVPGPRPGWVGGASWHWPTGKGWPENAPVTGLPAAYFIRKMGCFCSGARVSAAPRKPNTPTMGVLAKAMTDEEIAAAAEYFGARKWTPWTRVIETDLVPKTRIVGNLFVAIEQVKAELIAGVLLSGRKMRSRPRACAIRARGSVADVPVESI